MTLLYWFSFLFRIACGIAFIVFCAMRAKRAGGGTWLIAAFVALNVLVAVLFRASTFVKVDASFDLALTVIDAGSTFVSAILVFVGLVLLR